ncbi:MAG: 50S ribosomal protein L2 [Hydrogenobaculum sp.]|jgi:LSU ribosomal protein L2P|uniref:50S ribosomal protein L2 n=1 Tax=unclassified Hydrogenobaculum TaxID=2622382 RepID=UPI0001C5221C|nr:MULTISPECIES: 50S ribosomal protein L2 [unclassified Hydrogenobaculum]AEF18672.1 ribosomal protein L2 [Hydrogenobaculum sp. 3684]AEG45960.1 ribosomal protein L2 [Hydrogenobaculum sp. SHO]AGG14603.1 ribosomal protein L2 [Hydrogenobaculum sp. HO]AGH92902.1 ribosomal protein L2, bacterial/organellar [Hydrogenobaculum sp. SN]
MGVRKLKPVTNGQRHAILYDYSELTRREPEKSLTYYYKRALGRSRQQGKITSRWKGAGNKIRYRLIDFKRDKSLIPAKVYSIEYDPFRSARIALLHYKDGEKRYIVWPDKLNVGDTVVSISYEDAIKGKELPDIKPGNAMPLRFIPVGTFIHNIELNPGRGAKLVRAAGLSAQVIGKIEGYAQVRLPSGEVRLINDKCMATIGVVGLAEHELVKLGKAGRARWLGMRPNVRGTAMNPVDHPHGGGEGKTKGKHPESPWGWKTKGYKTKRGKRYSDRFIISKRNAGGKV